MPIMLNDENGSSSDSYSLADSVAPKELPSSARTNHHSLSPLEIAVRLLQDIAILHKYNCDANDVKEDDDDDDDGDAIEQADVLVRRIRTNDPKLTTLALRSVKILDRGIPISCIRGFTQNSIQRATKALHTNNTIRSISCRYDWRYPRRFLHLLRNDDDDADHYNGDRYSQLRATPYNQITKLQEHRFFEACMCLPQLESISLTGGNRWRVKHLSTMLETAKGLKRLTVRDVLIKNDSELNGLKRLLLGKTARRSSYATPILLEKIELTIEDQTERNDKYWTTSTAANIGNGEEEASPFDRLLEALISSPNVREISLSKSILSRFNLRPVHDVSTKTLLKLARCKTLRKLVLSEISVEQGGIEAMCESLIRTNGHLTHLEFYGCAFNHSVGQSGWNALFRLVDHDPTIQIRASSLVYVKRHNEVESDNDTRGRNSRSNASNIYNDNSEDEGENGLSAFMQRPREDFAFSLRDEDGTKKHFRNQGLDVRYMLKEAGFFRLLKAKEQAASSDWISVMTKVRDDSIALFCILRENPALCDRTASASPRATTNKYRPPLVMQDNKNNSNRKKCGREKSKRRKLSPAPIQSSWETSGEPLCYNLVTKQGKSRRRHILSPG